MSMTSEIYAKRAANRAAHLPGYTPKSEETTAPVAATAQRQPDTLGALMVGQSMVSTKPSKAALPDAAAVYAKREAQRSRRAAGSGETEE